jgi:hypothetical protein
MRNDMLNEFGLWWWYSFREYYKTQTINRESDRTYYMFWGLLIAMSRMVWKVRKCSRLHKIQM